MGWGQPVKQNDDENMVDQFDESEDEDSTDDDMADEDNGD
jgi:hypothetical protein